MFGFCSEITPTFESYLGELRRLVPSSIFNLDFNHAGGTDVNRKVQASKRERR